MQYRFLQKYKKNDLEDIAQTDYWWWHVSLRRAGINADVRTDEWIKNNYGAFKVKCTTIAPNDCFQGNNFQNTNC